MFSRRNLFQYSAALGAVGLVGASSPGGSDMDLKLGKAPATPERVGLKLGDYVTNVPPPPPNFGHQSLVPNWGMKMNDTIGCCVWSGAAHEHQLWTAEGKHPVNFTDQNVVQAYSAVAGYNPNLPEPNPTDRGTNVSDALRWRRTVGMTDAVGSVHQIEAYAQVATQPDAIAQAAWLFSAVGVGIRFPAYAMVQFKAGQPWDVRLLNSRILGGHYIVIVGRTDDMFICVTWGKLQIVTPRFLDKYCDEAYAIFDSEFFTNNRSPEGFDAATLQSDMIAMTA